MLHKIHYQHVALTMPLSPKIYSAPIRTENTLGYDIPTSLCDYYLYSIYPRTVRHWNSLPQDIVDYIFHPRDGQLDLLQAIFRLRVLVMVRITVSVNMVRGRK